MFKFSPIARRNILIFWVSLVAGILACSNFVQPLPAPVSEEDPAPEITPVLNAFTPGDPTATPLGTDIQDPNYIQGVLAYDAKKFDETIVLMTKVIDADPNLAPPYRYRGLAYMNLNQCEMALADFNQALDINRNYAAAWGGRGAAYSCLGDEARGLQDFETALALDPSLAFVRHNLGVYYYGIGDFQRSFEEYSMSVAIDPGRSGAWIGSAEALMQMGRFPECITNTSRALEVDREDWDAYKVRAACESYLENYSAAMEDYKIYLEKEPDKDALVWYNLGYAQYKSGLHQEAVISYTRALEMDPTYYPAYINRGLEYVQLEEYDKALQDYNQAIALGGEVGPAYSGRGDAHLGLERYEEAIADYERAMLMMPDRPHSFCMATFAYFEVGRYQDALDSAQTALDLDPNCGGQRLYEYQGRAYYALGDYEQAIFYMDKALQMGEFAMGYYYRGIIQHDAGNFEQARSDLERFISVLLNPDRFPEEVADAQQRLAELKP